MLKRPKWIGGKRIKRRYYRRFGVESSRFERTKSSMFDWRTAYRQMRVTKKPVF